MASLEDLSSVERARIAFELSATAERLTRQKIRQENPGLTADEVEERVFAWYQTRPGAELGDGPGVPAERFLHLCSPSSNRH